MSTIDLTSTPRSGQPPTPPPAPPRRWHWLVRVALAVVAMHAMLLGVLPGFLLMQLVPEAEQDSAAFFWQAQLPVLLVPVTCILLVWALMRYVDRRPLTWSGLRWSGRTLPLLALGTVVMTAVQVLAIGLVRGTGHAYAPFEGGWDTWWMSLIDLLIRSLLMAALCEELLFRGYVLQTLPLRSPWLVAGISALTFGVLHLNSQGQDSPLPYVLQATGFAFLAAAFALVTRDLGGAIGVHLGVYVASDVAQRLGWGEGTWTYAVNGLLALALGAIIIAGHARRHPTVPDPLYAD